MIEPKLIAPSNTCSRSLICAIFIHSILVISLENNSSANWMTECGPLRQFRANGSTLVSQAKHKQRHLDRDGVTMRIVWDTRQATESFFRRIYLRFRHSFDVHVEMCILSQISDWISFGRSGSIGVSSNRFNKLITDLLRSRQFKKYQFKRNDRTSQSPVRFQLRISHLLVCSMKIRSTSSMEHAFLSNGWKPPSERDV